MCSAIAICVDEFPDGFVASHGLAPRLYNRGGGAEIRFYYRDPVPLLPVIDGGQLRILSWGNQSRHATLPGTGWTWKASVEEGNWSWANAERVVIPAQYGFERGVWFKITQGICGLLVRPPHEEPRVYMICEPPSRYFRVMTRSDRMPLLIGEVI